MSGNDGTRSLRLRTGDVRGRGYVIAVSPGRAIDIQITF